MAQPITEKPKTKNTTIITDISHFFLNGKANFAQPPGVSPPAALMSNNQCKLAKRA
jgi:hypothetical protein